MRVPLNWLADYVDYEMTTPELANGLTMLGQNVESIDRPAAAWNDVIVGQIRELQPHPTSRNPLNVASVDVGDTLVTIVTGAPNVRRGDKVPVVLVGGTLPHGPDGKPLRIAAKPMAGIDSEGMLASARELGLSDDHAGIYVLPGDAVVGEPLASFMGEDVLDIETVSNRPDTLSIVGIAREVAALTQQQVTLPDPTAIDENVEWIDEQSITVRVEAPDLCPRYSALRIQGVRVQPSPAWLAGRLEAAGMRPINLPVDITNYVMLELGQPLHAFDARMLRGGEIVVRRAHADEHLRTLDGVDRVMSADTLLIADAERAVAVAGVMGGEESEIGDGTTAIVLESANFNAASVRGTAKRLGLRTEASSRFERGLPPETTVPALFRYLQLLAQISDTELRVSQLSDVRSCEPEPRSVRMPLRDLDRLVGVPIDPDTAASSLSLLGFSVTVEDDAILAEVPYWRRVDIEQSADLVEEVARVVGFDTLPSTLPRGGMPPKALPRGIRLRGIVRDRLLPAGANEITTHSLTSLASMGRLRAQDSPAPSESPEMWQDIVPNASGVERRGAAVSPVRLQNPSSTDRQVLRLTLLPSILDVLGRNLKHTDERLAFFEIDRTFFRREGELPYERETLAIALSGKHRPAFWREPSPQAFSFYHIKGMVEAVLESLGIEHAETVRASHPALHPGRSAALYIGDEQVAYFGQLHPAAAARFELETWPVQVAEIDLDALFEHASETRLFRPLPKYPAAYRDIAVVVAASLPAADVLSVARARAGSILESARIFDVYEGAPLPSGKKSVAIGFVFRSSTSTLTQERVQATMTSIIEGLENELGATLRE